MVFRAVLFKPYLPCCELFMVFRAVHFRPYLPRCELLMVFRAVNFRPYLPCCELFMVFRADWSELSKYAWGSCGTNPGVPYPDSRPMGFPFDRV